MKNVRNQMKNEQHLNKLKINNMERLQGYSVKTKKKMDFVDFPVIHKTSRGWFMVKGFAEDGNKMNVIMSAANAQKAVADGLATKEGW